VLSIAVVAMRGPLAGFLEDDFDGSLQDATGRKQRLGDLLQAVRAAAHHDDFKATLVVEVHVHRRAHLVAKLVLHLREALRELADMMVVDDGHARESVDASVR
jgi:hypothetical protein